MRRDEDSRGRQDTAQRIGIDPGPDGAFTQGWVVFDVADDAAGRVADAGQTRQQRLRQVVGRGIEQDGEQRLRANRQQDHQRQAPQHVSIAQQIDQDKYQAYADNSLGKLAQRG